MREELANCAVVADSVAKSDLKGLEAAWLTGVWRPGVRTGRTPDIETLLNGKGAKAVIPTHAITVVQSKQGNDQRRPGIEKKR